ncbi:NrfD/PsrC family molybdoenzyme membrane anchor subunit [Streptomyces sulphureus]|uniref:NrfD/PsrC family molybdoenzyme membrane anchor subunit n=1 Tax=Streptomyces sulphureus TaxID=47758 RepID=UPI00036486D5|nr:NrfD/PsrC family molybdoenzyme membrane anchor subunit [Streptomyces sulphureus]
MSESDVTPEGVRGARPGREAVTGRAAGRRRRGGRGERPVVPEAEFSTYYGMPVLNPPRWEALDIAGYLYLGGLAGASSLLAAGAHLTARRRLALVAKSSATGAVSLSLVALIHDLGRPERFLNMLRVFKPTSPMNVGSWLLAGYAPLTMAALLSDVSGRYRPAGAAATAGAAVLGPLVTTYTAVLLADTAVPSWHDGYRQLPFAFAGSGAAAAAGVGLLAAPVAETAPACKLASLGAGLELGSTQVMKRRIVLTSEPFEQGHAGTLMRASKALTVGGTLLAVCAGRRSRVAASVAGAALLAGSAMLRFGVFRAGVASAEDPKYTVVPQRARLKKQRNKPSAATS